MVFRNRATCSLDGLSSDCWGTYSHRVWLIREIPHFEIVRLIGPGTVNDILAHSGSTQDILQYNIARHHQMYVLLSEY